MSKVKDDIRRGIQNALIDSKIQEDQYPAQYGLTPRAVGDKVQQANNMAAQQQQAAAMGNAAVTQQPVQRPVSYAEMVQKLSPYRTPSKEQIAKQERLRKAQAAISAFGDGASAIANLIATTKGSPNVERPKPNLSDRSMARWEQLRQERKADADKYYQQMMRAVQMDENQNNYETQLRIRQQQQDRLDRDLRRKEAIAEAQTDRYHAMQSKDLAAVEYTNAKIRALEEGKSLDQALKEAKIAEVKARERLSNVKANAGGFAPKSGSRGGRGGSKGAKYVVYDQDGNPHYYDNATMYKQAVEQYGSGLAQTEKVGRKDVRRTTDSKAGELARNAAEKRKAAQQSNTKPQAQQSKTKKGSQGSKGGKYGNTKKLGL